MAFQKRTIVIVIGLVVIVVAIALAIVFGVRYSRHSTGGYTPAASNCSGLDRPFNGDVTYSNETNIGSIAVFACALGYKVQGPQLRKCSISGQWVPGNGTTCNRRGCGQPEHLNNGELAFTNGTFFRDRVSYLCNVGYTLQGPKIKTCTDNEKWEPVQPNQCEIQDCGSPPEISNGNMKFSNGTVFESSVTFRCQNGYRLDGPQERKCSSQGIWLPENKTGCNAYERTNLCPKINATEIDNLPLRLIGYNLTSDEKPLCDYYLQIGWYSMQDYVLTDSTVQCGTVHSWRRLGDLPVDIGTIEVLTMCRSTGNGSCDATMTARTTRCSDGNYLFELQDTNRCPEAFCLEKRSTTDCDNLNNLRDGKIVYTNGTMFGSVAYFKCNLGYELDGTPERTCSGFGFWQPRGQAFCLPIKCEKLESLQNGFVKVSNGRFLGSVATMICEKGFKLSSAEYRTCSKYGTWEPGPASECFPIDCGNLTSLASGVIQYNSGTLIGDTVSFNCDTGFDLVGPSEKQCDINGVWKPLEKVFCSHTRCAKLPFLPNGTISFSNQEYYGSIAYFTCDTGFILVGDARRNCNIKGQWIPQNPSQCVLNYLNATRPGVAHVHPKIAFEVETIKGNQMLNCFCDFMPPSGMNNTYTVRWFLTKEAICIKIIYTSEPKQYTSPSDFRSYSRLTEDMLLNDTEWKPGSAIVCSVTMGYTQSVLETMPAISPERWMGIEVLNKTVLLRNLEYVDVNVRLMIPFTCNNGEHDCDLPITIEIPGNTESCQIPDVVQISTDEFGCRLNLKNSDINKPRRLGFALRLGNIVYPIQKNGSINLFIDSSVTQRLFRNYTLDPVRIILSSDSSIIHQKQCYSNNDPHMKTFDGITYENQNEERFLLYNNPAFQQQVQIQTTHCLGRDVPVFCNCGVMISSGRDIFVVNNCGGNGIWDIRFRLCEDGVLNNRINKISIYHFQVYFPTGTIVDLSLQEKFVNVAVFPSLADFNNTEGLCGRFDGDTVNDLNKRPGSENDTILSWKLFPHEDLFGETYNLTQLNDTLKMCSCKAKESGLKSCTHGSAKLCQFEPSFTQSCKDESRKRRSVLEIGDYHGAVGVGSVKGNTGTGLLTRSLEKRSSLRDVDYDFIKAREECLKVINTTAVRLCKLVPGMNIETYIGDCVLDVLYTNNSEWALLHLELIKRKCSYDVKSKQLPAKSALKNLTLVLNDSFIDYKDNQTLPIQAAFTEEFLKVIMDAICPLECNKRGICIKGKCVCDLGFTGVDCSTITSLPPEMLGLPDDGLCDLTKRRCERTSVYGNNLADGVNFTCRFKIVTLRNTGTIISTGSVFLTGAKLNTFMEAECRVNARSLRKREVEDFGEDTLAHGSQVALSNDGQIFSQDMMFITYDSRCVNCTIHNGEKMCSPKPGFCVRNGFCYIKDDISNCHKCIIKEDESSDWETMKGCGEQHPNIINNYYYSSVDEGSNIDLIVSIVSSVITLVVVIVEAIIILCDRLSTSEDRNQPSPHSQTKR
ncbi:SVEP1-like protein [Mya arenaria]|uniref:SVEP1-like protein n=1 Tax=Mya arenaria TaxID=6604 RepID=A0ABY7G6J2_MYAAR|nr:SVEP1-like protein [Mya arenaria]